MPKPPKPLRVKEPVYIILPLRGAPLVGCHQGEVTIQWLLPRTEVEIVLSSEDALELEDGLHKALCVWPDGPALP